MKHYVHYTKSPHCPKQGRICQVHHSGGIYQHTSQFLNGLSSTLKRPSAGLADLSNTTDRHMTLYDEHNDRDAHTHTHTHTTEEREEGGGIERGMKYSSFSEMEG